MEQNYRDFENEIDYESDGTMRDIPFATQIRKKSFENGLFKKSTELNSTEQSTSFDSNNKFTYLELKLKVHDDLIKKCLEIIDLIKRLSADSKNIKFVEEILKYILSCKHELDELFNKLKKNEFDLVIVGLEKAGKTSFLNAWLTINFLPTRRKRCTYTTTEVKSCSSENEQRIFIEYLTTKEFETNKREIAEKIKKMNQTLPADSIVVTEREISETVEGLIEVIESSTLRETPETDLPTETKHQEEEEEHSSINWLEEYKEILKIEKSAKEYLDKKPLTKYFKDFNGEIEKLVHDTISNPAIARAVRRVVLYTQKLNTKQKITFHDVPGYNSPTTMHKKQTKEKGKIADAIMFVKKFVQPDLEQSEIEMFSIFDTIDEFVPLKDKLIGAITFIDQANDRDDYDKTLIDLENSFAAKGISKDRLFPVCSAARNLNDENSRKKALTNLNELGIDDGFDKLISYVYDYLVDSRASNLEKKLDIVSSRINKSLNSLIKISKTEFDLNDTNLENNESLSDQEERNKMKWWAQEWRKVHEDFKEFIQTNIYVTDDPDQLAENHEFLEEFRNEYIKLIESMISDTKKVFDTRYKRIYNDQGHSGGNIAAGEGHSAIRKELTEEMYRKVSEILSESLGNIIWETIGKIIDWINVRVWLIEDIPNSLITNDEKNAKKIICQKVETLILRLSRPAIDLFLRFPRHDNRIKTIKQYKNEVMILDMFYKENNIRQNKELPSYLANGQFDNSSYTQLEFDEDKLIQNKPTTSLPEAIEQIKQDIDQFGSYMINSVYYGSGLESFFKQELDRIIHLFRLEEQNERYWQHLVFKAIKDGNSKIPYRHFEFNIEIKKKLANFINEVEGELKSNKSYKN